MRNAAFYLFTSFLRLLSLFPFRLLYIISSAVYPIVYYVFPYRKSLVFKNLKNSFPEKNEKEIKRIARAFYKHFCDLFIESAASSYKKKNKIINRFRIKNPEVCDKLYMENKSISLLMAHYCAWEWSTVLPNYVKHIAIPIYKPLNSEIFDKYIRNKRARFGAIPVALEKIFRTLIRFEKENTPTITYFIADQRPLMAKIQYWTKFLNQDTPVVMGPEKIARHFNHTILFLKVNKLRRGFYEAEFIEIGDARELKKYDIIEKYHEELERLIKEKPEYWLWTHDRWKHKKEDYLELRKRSKKKK